MKKLLCAILSSILLISMSISASAALPDQSVQPMWENMNRAIVTLTFSGTTGTASVSVSRISGVTTEIEGTLTIYEVDGDDLIYIDSAYESSTRALGFSMTFDATSGAEYKAVLEVTAHSASSSESATVSDTGTCP